MILYFADRKMNIIGQASTELPEGQTVCEDLKTEDTETGVATFECKIPFNKKMRSEVERCAEVGNYILRSHDAENEFYTIIETEIDTKNQEVYIYAEDAGLDLLNEVVGEYAADKAYPINHYINKFAYDSGFEIGINEAKNLTRKLSWDGEVTATERIASVATQFGDFEVSYSFKIDGLTVVKKYINIFKKRGKDNGVQLRLNKEIDSIVTSKSIANLATALKCEGGTPEEAEKPINLKGYKYDDGDIYVGSDGILRSRTACKKWSRYVWNLEPNKIDGNVGNIVKAYSYDTTSQQELCNRAITELKKIREIEVNYEVDISKLPDNVKIGDRVNIVDDAGELYLSARILQLETSVADKTHKAILGEHLIKDSGTSQKVIELSTQFAKTSHSAAQALSIANIAKTAANNAQTQADAAVADAANAQKAAEDATAAANTATESAVQAQTAAANAQAAVETVIAGRILWSGDAYMSGSQQADLSELISDQPSGIVLVFSRYSSGAVGDYHFNQFFVHKSFVAVHPGGGSTFLMTTDGTFSAMAAKYLYIHDDKIVGNDVNTETGTGTCGINYENNGFVLRYVIGV